MVQSSLAALCGGAFRGAGRAFRSGVRSLLPPISVFCAGSWQFTATDVWSLPGTSTSVGCHTVFLLFDVVLYGNNYLIVERAPVPIGYSLQRKRDLKWEIDCCLFLIFHDGIIPLLCRYVKRFSQEALYPKYTSKIAPNSTSENAIIWGVEAASSSRRSLTDKAVGGISGAF